MWVVAVVVVELMWGHGVIEPTGYGMPLSGFWVLISIPIP
jgi:hypothetical protein